jgi:hypothetical protein
MDNVNTNTSIPKLKSIRKEKEFLNLKVPLFVNKNTGQLSLVLPRKQMKSMTEKKIPNKLNITIR